MTQELLLALFQKLCVWERDGKRAPHKPLLALLAIGRCLAGGVRLMPYAHIEEPLKDLLRRFHRNAGYPYYPFWFLKNDGLWELDRPELVALDKTHHPRRPSLMQHSIKGGFKQPVYNALRNDPSFAIRAAWNLLHAHFPASQDDISQLAQMSGFAQQIGTQEEHPEYETTQRPARPRQVVFRENVLKAYANQCAVCEFSVSVNRAPIGLEAAHIKWHQADGPAETRNGIALCVMHHELFDAGVFTLHPEELKVIVYEQVSGSGTDAHLGEFHEKRLRYVPRDKAQQPDPEFLLWHAQEVFRGHSHKAL